MPANPVIKSPTRVGYQSGSHYSTIRAVEQYLPPKQINLNFGVNCQLGARDGFEVHDVEGWWEHYASTTRPWHDRALVNRDAAEREGLARLPCRAHSDDRDHPSRRIATTYSD
jgi:cyclopropane fatty-acyl-phospholipid synthase-like methyltransferase